MCKALCAHGLCEFNFTTHRDRCLVRAEACIQTWHALAHRDTTAVVFIVVIVVVIVIVVIVIVVVVIVLVVVVVVIVAIVVIVVVFWQSDFRRPDASKLDSGGENKAKMWFEMYRNTHQGE